MFLLDAVDGIDLPQNIRKILNDPQRSHISSTALNLEAAVINCLSVVIKCTVNGVAGLPAFQSLLTAVVLEAAVAGYTNLTEAKEAVEVAIGRYHWALSSLNVNIGVQTLDILQEQQKKSLIKKFSNLDPTKDHEDKNTARVEPSFESFMQSRDLKDWIDGESRFLVGSGGRMLHLF